MSRTVRNGPMSLENSRFSTSVVMPICTVSKRRQLLVAFEHVERADVLSEAVGLDHRFGKGGDILEAEIEALAGDRVDAVGGVAGERDARRDEGAGSVRPSGQARGLSATWIAPSLCRNAARARARRRGRRRRPVFRASSVRSIQTIDERLVPLPSGLSGNVAKGPAGRKCSSARPLCGRSCATVQTMPDWPYSQFTVLMPAMSRSFELTPSAATSSRAFSVAPSARWTVMPALRCRRR